MCYLLLRTFERSWCFKQSILRDAISHECTKSRTSSDTDCGKFERRSSFYFSWTDPWIRIDQSSTTVAGWKRPKMSAGQDAAH